MPRKIRELKTQIAREDFRIYLSVARVAMSVGDILYSEKRLPFRAKDGDDVPLYLEKQLAQLLAELDNLKGDEDS